MTVDICTAPVDTAPAETLAELENAIVDDESIGETPHADESMDALAGANTHTPGEHRTSHGREDNSQWLVKSPMDPGSIRGEALLEGEVLPPPSPRDDAKDVDVQDEVFEEATRVGRDLIRGLLPTPRRRSGRRWRGGRPGRSTASTATDREGDRHHRTMVGRILSDAEGGSPGTPPHDDEPPRETPPPPAPPPLAPEDARKLELAAPSRGAGWRLTRRAGTR